MFQVFGKIVESLGCYRNYEPRSSHHLPTNVLSCDSRGPFASQRLSESGQGGSRPKAPDIGWPPPPPLRCSICPPQAARQSGRRTTGSSHSPCPLRRLRPTGDAPSESAPSTTPWRIRSSKKLSRSQLLSWVACLLVF